MNEKKQKHFRIVKIILGSLIYIFFGIFAMGFIYISSKSNRNIEDFYKYSKKVLLEVERHELLKHQIAQGTLTLKKEVSTAKNNCEPDPKSKNNKNKKDNCVVEQDNKSSNEVVTTKVFRVDEVIELDNASIKNDAYNIVTTYDFTNSKHLFSHTNQLCQLVKYLAPDLKDNIFTTVKIGNYIVRKNSKININTDEDNMQIIYKDCTSQEPKIIIETKFYPNDPNSSPAMYSNALSSLSNFNTLISPK